MILLDQLPALFSLLRETLENNLDHLNALDAETGDGDHGYTMLRAFQAAEISAQLSYSHIGAVFDACAEALAENAGGAIGPLMAALFSEGGLVFSQKEQINCADLGVFLEKGKFSIMEIGGAKPGDKTLLDALAPAAAAMQKFQEKPLEEALSEAAQAAQTGALGTRDMVSRFGRASFSGERSAGKTDAGATSMALMIQTFLNFCQGKRAVKQRKSEKAGAFTPPGGRFINNPDSMIREDNQGLALAYPDLVTYHPDGVLLRNKPKKTGEVALVIGHGGGHTPSMGGFIGPGLLDADIYGPLFTCASGVRIARGIELAHRDAGVALLVSNHSGDVLNARLAARRAREKGIEVEQIILSDDIATAPRADHLKRRGLGGLLFALKIGGAAAEMGQTLSETARLMRKTNQRTATLMVSGRAPQHPVTGNPLFTLPENQVEIGSGVHGEVGVYRGEHMPADEIVDLITGKLLTDLAEFTYKKVLAFINGAGGTSRMELHILYRRLHENLKKNGLDLTAGVVDSYFTTFEMGGFSISLCATDDELQQFWNMPASAPNFRWPYA